MNLLSFFRGLVVPCLVLCAASAQNKRPLTHADYDQWRSINASRLSDDGKYLAYAWMPYDADGEVVVRELATGREFRHPAGTLPPPPIVNLAELEPGAEPPSSVIRLAFTSDGKHLAASAYPAKAETQDARKARRRAEDMPKQSLLLIELASGKLTRIERVKNFQVPANGGPWVAYLKEAPAPARPSDNAKPQAAAAPGDDAAADQEGAPAASSAGTPRREFGTDLILRNLDSGQERAFANVASYSFAKDGRTLAYAVSSRKEEENGVFAVTPGADAAQSALLAGKGKYQKLTWDRAQTQLAFFSDKDDAAAKTPRQKIYLWDRKAAAASELIADGFTGAPAGLVLSDKGNLAFSRDGKRLFVPFGTEPKAPREPEPTEDRVQMDLWHWQDGLVQPMQKVRANQERNRTYSAVFHLAERKLVPIADARMATVSFSDSGLWGVGSDDRNYRRLVDFDGNYSDLYAVDTTTGTRRSLWRRARTGGGRGGAAPISPDGAYAALFQDRHWYSLRLADGAIRNLTGALGVAFHDEEDDTPDPPPSYGFGGWSSDGKNVVLYDRYDVWLVAADGSSARNVTGGEGRKQKISWRVQRLQRPGEDEEDEDGRYLDTTRPMVLRGASEETRATGFYQGSYQGGPLKKLLWGDANYTVRGQARKADAILLSASRFDRFPDLHFTDAGFASPKQLTDGDSQRAAFLWGKAETIAFRNIDGVALKATLIKPENFDPRKKYPMIVYIYEKLSQGLHNFVNPAPGTSINFAYYASNGYLILTPDIVYTVGNPGQSALKCVLPAIQAVVDQGFVDEKAIGIQGHSWGGYQIAYMVTQTNRFRAAEAGAPVGNMTSAYSGIRWGSGMPRQFQYEQTQSRIGPSLYDAPHKYLENSPIFHIKRVETPLLILHNDQDDAVPWYQGIELFLALRRNGKEAYLLNYNGEFHGLRRRHNQRDYTVRMQQFFDHFLKGAPKPEWMQKGVPFIERDEEKERFAAGPAASGDPR